MRGLDRVGGGEVVVLAGVDDDAGAGVDLAAEALVDEGAHRVDVAEEDAVHRVVEHHVEPLEAGQRRDLRHAQAAGVVGQPDVAAELLAGLVERGAHQPEVLLGGVGAGEALAGRALGHVVEQRLAGRPDHRDHVGALAGGLLGLRDVLVDVAGRDDQVDPRLAGSVADPLDEPLALAAARVDAAYAGGDLLARSGAWPSGRRGPRAAGTGPSRPTPSGRASRGPRPRRAAARPRPAARGRARGRRRRAPRRRAGSPTGCRRGRRPASPARRSVARSTETVVCCWASLTIGRPTLRARLRALPDGDRVEVELRLGLLGGRHVHSLRSNRARTAGVERTSSRARSAWPGT